MAWKFYDSAGALIRSVGPTGETGAPSPWPGEEGEPGFFVPGERGATGATGAPGGGGGGSGLDPVFIDAGEPTGSTFFGYNVLDGGTP